MKTELETQIEALDAMIEGVKLEEKQVIEIYQQIIKNGKQLRKKLVELKDIKSEFRYEAVMIELDKYMGRNTHLKDR